MRKKGTQFQKKVYRRGKRKTTKCEKETDMAIENADDADADADGQ